MNKEYSILRMKNPIVAKPATWLSSPARGGFEAAPAAEGLEVRPGGMLVQKRSSDSNQNYNPVPNIKVKVKYGSVYHEILIASQSNFGEMKKMLAGLTGLHTQDQKLIYKEKERDSKAFLDNCGVKNGSKIVLIEDELSKERRILESRKNSKMDKASKEIAAIKFEVDKLAKQVARIEMEINGGKKVVETVLLSLIELLMTQLINLDAIAADGDVKLQRRMQVKRVQKYIEVVDMLKIKNSGMAKIPLQQQRNNQMFTGKIPQNFQKQQEQRKQGNLSAGAFVVTTKWETF
ncbi:hypothetical protein ABFS82_01G079600 [Erythranthe guttata]|uniref:Ubiquitin-like domain-containing protein n=1 Tax=Erythranthe guttata TaxID=4155 RepID=A0A022RFM4_ERYGU|nr:PREDICTED: BAG family molecular chaperone regulator 1-like [Erythranthe guttata]EYU38991.1 hypothetical protein MIMGU_mgv1a011152mg [Erythranthe guttata]|eukprot:XP_012835459.1 PREDICTED: BAG family molecular chaperone regulator 1-like [Erythranthe guttata]